MVLREVSKVHSVGCASPSGHNVIDFKALAFKSMYELERQKEVLRTLILERGLD